MFKKRDRNEVRVIRHARVRKKISGTPEMPRLCVYRSNKYIYAQVIDDTKGITLVQASSLEKDVMAQITELTRRAPAKLVGKLVAERALAGGHQRGRLRPRRLCLHRPRGRIWLPALARRGLDF